MFVSSTNPAAINSWYIQFLEPGWSIRLSCWTWMVCIGSIDLLIDWIGKRCLCTVRWCLLGFDHVVSNNQSICLFDMGPIAYPVWCLVTDPGAILDIFRYIVRKLLPIITIRWSCTLHMLSYYLFLLDCDQNYLFRFGFGVLKPPSLLQENRMR